MSANIVAKLGSKHKYSENYHIKIKKMIIIDCNKRYHYKDVSYI